MFWERVLLALTWGGMTNSEALRGRASRLFALAIRAREDGSSDYADELIQLANETLAKAEEIEPSVGPDCDLSSSLDDYRIPPQSKTRK